MANRTIQTTLKLNVSDFKSGVRQASSSLDELAKKGDKTERVSGTYLGQMEQSIRLQRGAWDSASTSLLGWGAALTGVLGVAQVMYSNFDEAMSAVQASTHAGAEEMDLFREAAIQAGADSRYSATEAAGAIEELAKAGVSAADILGGGLTGALDLAAAGGMDVAQAAEIASIALTQFGLSGSDVGHVADLLAAGAGKANGDVSDLGMALKQAGLVANQTGLSIEETVGGLTAFASAGLLGSDAGTSFKSMLQRLTPQSKTAASTMEDLGISAYDAEGNFVGLTAFAGNLKNSMKDLTPEARNAAMGIMFGSDAIRAASILYEEGAEGIQEWIDQVNDAGYAAETAAARMDNLKGDWENFTGSIESVVLQSGGGINDFLRSLVQGAEGAVDAVNKVPGPVLEMGAAVTGIVGFGALAAGGFMKITASAYDTLVAMRDLQHLAPRLGGALSGIARVAGPAAAGIATLLIINKVGDAFESAPIPEIEATTAALLDLKDSSGGLDALFKGVGDSTIAGTDTLRRNLGAVDSFQAGIDRLVNPSMTQRLRDFNKEVFSLGRSNGSNELEGVTEQFNAMGDSLAGLVQSGHGERAAQIFDEISRQWTASGGSLEDLQALMPGYVAALEQVENEARLAADASGDLAGGHSEAADAAEEQKTALLELIGVLSDYASSMLNERQAQRNLIETVGDANEVFAENAEVVGQGIAAFDRNTEAGRANEAALDSVAEAGWRVIESMLNATDANGQAVYSTGEVQAAMTGVRASFIESATAAGLSSDAANKLADDLGLIPENVHTDITSEDGTTGPAKEAKAAVDSIPESKHSTLSATDNASWVADKVRNAIAMITDKTVTITARHVSNSGSASMGQQVPGSADGGRVVGVGTTTSDSNLYRLSVEEHVLSAREVTGMGGHSVVEAMRAAARSNRFLSLFPGHADGGRPGFYGRSVAVPVPSFQQVASAAPVNVEVRAFLENPFTGAEVEARMARTVVKYV